MWIALSDAFLSIVSKGKDKSKLCVRARRREHIERVFPGEPVIDNAGTDYPFRAYIGRDKVADVISRQLKNLCYNNFKNSAKNDADLARAYGWVWAVMLQLREDYTD